MVPSYWKAARTQQLFAGHLKLIIAIAILIAPSMASAADAGPPKLAPAKNAAAAPASTADPGGGVDPARHEESPRVRTTPTPERREHSAALMVNPVAMAFGVFNIDAGIGIHRSVSLNLVPQLIKNSGVTIWGANLGLQLFPGERLNDGWFFYPFGGDARGSAKGVDDGLEEVRLSGVVPGLDFALGGAL